MREERREEQQRRRQELICALIYICTYVKIENHFTGWYTTTYYFLLLAS